MDQQSALIMSAAEVAQAFVRTAREQARAAEAQSWATVYELADFRDILLRRLTEITSAPLSERERDTLADAIRDVQALDVEITCRAEGESRRLLGELAEVEHGRAIAHGYAWASAPRQATIVNRYG